MDQRQLEHFIAVADELSFTRAARRLSLAQSTVSTSIRSLERELGQALLQRSTRVVRLTEQGEAFLPEAKAALEAFSRVRATVDPGGTSLRGTLAVGTLSGMSVVDVPGLAAHFLELHPEVRLSIATSPAGTRGLLEKLRAHQLDVAFVGLPDVLAVTDIEARELVQLPFDVLVPDDHRLARRASVTIADIADETFIDLPSGFGLRTIVDAAFQHAGVTRRIGVEVVDMTYTPDYVAAGLGIAVTNAVPSLAGRPLRMVPLVRPRLSWTLYVATPHRRTPTRAATAFLDLLPGHVHDRGVF